MSLPDGFRKWHKEQRIKYHLKRVRRESQAYEILETYKSELTKDQISATLHNVKKERIKLEELILLLESEEFQEFEQKLSSQKISLRDLELQLVKLLLIKSKTKKIRVDHKIDSLKGEIKKVKVAILDSRKEFIEFCKVLGIQKPEEYLE